MLLRRAGSLALLALLLGGCIESPPAGAATDAGNNVVDMGSDPVERDMEPLPLEDAGELVPDAADEVDASEGGLLEVSIPRRVEALTSGGFDVKLDGRPLMRSEFLILINQGARDILRVEGNGWAALKPGIATVIIEAEGASTEIEVEVEFEIASMGLGRGHTCIATALAGNVYCLGRNDDGQVGDTDEVNRVSTWTHVPLMLGTRRVRATQVVAGLNFSCAMGHQGNVLCWGANGSRQLGSTGESSTVARPISWANGFQSISAGELFVCGRSNQDVVCWGSNEQGQTGGANSSNWPAVRALVDSPQVVEAGYRHACAISDNKVYCWGDDGLGQLGSGIAVAPEMREVSVQAPIDLMAGVYTSCVTTASGLYCWGADGYVGTVSGALDVLPPTLIDGVGQVTAMSAQEGTMMTLNGAGEVFAWGDNYSGIFGNSTQDASGTPQRVGQGGEFTKISAGSIHACGLIEGELFCWGENDDYQLGETTATRELTPKLMPMPWDQGPN